MSNDPAPVENGELTTDAAHGRITWRVLGQGRAPEVMTDLGRPGSEAEMLDLREVHAQSLAAEGWEFTRVDGDMLRFVRAPA